MPCQAAEIDEPPLVLTEDEAEDVAELYARCADYFQLQDGEAATLADVIEMFSDVPDEKSAMDQTVLGWRDDGRLYALAAILRDFPADGIWYLGFMIVDPAKRRQGIGRSIYQTIEQWAAGRGAREMRLSVLEVNEGADRFWRSLGYKELRRVGPHTFKTLRHRRIELARALSNVAVGVDSKAMVAAFPFDHPGEPVSLYDYAPVLRVRDRRGDWVLKRTGLVHSDGVAIGRWLTALRALSVNVVAPAAHFYPNPRRLSDGKDWVVYPFVSGTGYNAANDEIANAGRLLGQMHAAQPLEASALATYAEPVVRDVDWIAPHLASAEAAMTVAGADNRSLRAVTEARLAVAEPIRGLPLAGCSFDFKASNLVFSPKPTLVDPDHAARMPRLYDLAVALLLFHCDLPAAPGRLWTTAEWAAFLRGYGEHVAFTGLELASWRAVLELAWLDQGVWLLGNWPEGWAEAKDRAFLLDLSAFDPANFPLMLLDQIVGA